MADYSIKHLLLFALHSITIHYQPGLIFHCVVEKFLLILQHLYFLKYANGELLQPTDLHIQILLKLAILQQAVILRKYRVRIKFCLGVN